MKLNLVIFLTLIGLGSAQADFSQRVESGQAALKDLKEIANYKFPNMWRGFKKSFCVATIRVVHGGFGWGGKIGQGLASCRTSNGFWGAPLPIDLVGINKGWQVGLQVVDFTLLFLAKDAAVRIAGDNLLLGANGGFSLGPVGRNGAIATNYSLRDKVYAFSKSQGLYAGLTIEGQVLRVNRHQQDQIYGDNSQAIEVLRSPLMPKESLPFINVLNGMSK